MATKTPEEMAEEYGAYIDLCCGTSDILIAAEQAFLTGYQAAKPKWISVKDRLPEIDEWVLIDGPVICQRIDPPSANWKADYAWNTDHETFYYPDDVTHWMPLPEAPKDEA